LLAAALNAETSGLWRPAAGERVSPGATVEARWTLSPSDPRVGDEAELLLSLDGGRSFSLRVSREVLPESGRAVWRVPSLPSSHARLALRTGRSGEDESESVILVGAEFEIAVTQRGVAEELFRGRAEWTTRAAARDAGASPPVSTGGWEGAPDLARPHDCDPALEPRSTAASNLRLEIAQGRPIRFRQLRRSSAAVPAAPSGHFPRRE
nr:hypothetical protein [Acidobacteriota bacterium]